MRSGLFRIVLCCCLAGLSGQRVLSMAAQNADVEGSKDHPLVSRYPGSWIVSYAYKEYDEYLLPTGKVQDDKPTKSQKLEGKVTRITYQAPKGRSVLEVYRNFEGALTRAGFQTLFACQTDDCGSGQVSQSVVGDRTMDYWHLEPGSGQRHLSAQLTRPEGDAYISLHMMNVDEGPAVQLDVIEIKPMESGLVTVNAETLAGDITRTGHASVYGIYFDTGKAEIKPESDPTLKEVAKLMQQHPDMKLYVVGHTDNVGTLAANMDLSKRRAAAVADALSAKYGVPAPRLHGEGVGPLSPVASNATDDGRAKNRRVELVAQ